MNGVWDWPEVILVLGLLTLGLCLLGGYAATRIENRRIKVQEAQVDELRQLVSRYEKLAETTLDAQQRTATDVSELRTRTAAIEQILRTVE
jgi:hypothetical protein